jgi:hypothetical protein
MKKYPSSDEILARLSEERNRKVLNLCADLLVAIERDGVVRAISGVVFCGKGRFLMSTTDMYDVVMKLRGIGIEVRRIDSGGQPTWALA